MANRNYKRGQYKEYKICNMLKDLGFDIAQRTAGSHSPFDVIGIDIKNKVIRLVQSKPDSMSDNERKKLLDENTGLNGPFIVEFEVI